MRYRHNHNYTMKVSLGFVGAERQETLNPAVESSYSEEEWNALSDEEKKEWLNSQLQEWADSYIDMSISE